MSAGDLISIRLQENDLGQIIDGLEVLAEDWEQTQRFMEFGESGSGGIIRECSNEREAGKIARHYRRIIEALEEQLDPS